MNFNNNGYLEIFIGPMFSGKTTKLYDLYNLSIQKRESIIAVNYIEDTRYHNSLLSTHDEKMIPCVQCKNLSEIIGFKQITDSETILINEAQFFEDLFEHVIYLVEELHKKVFLCGLDGDFKRSKFGQVLDLIPFCDKVTKLNAKCGCKNNAIFSHRLSQEEQQVVIGSSNYVPLCRNCYLLKNP